MIRFMPPLHFLLLYQYIINASSKGRSAPSVQVQTNQRFIGICLNLHPENPDTPTNQSHTMKSQCCAPRATYVGVR